MKKFAKLCLIILSLCVFTSITIAKEYTDLSHEHWAYKQIQILSNNGILAGYPDDTFHPDEQVTRAEFSTMVIKAFGLTDYPVTSPVEFNDISEDYWAWANIQRAIALDLLKGLPENTFAPNNSISKAEAYAVVVNSMNTDAIPVEKAEEILQKRFIDYDSIPAWAVVHIGKAEILGMVVNTPDQDGNFNADVPATRAELSVLLLNMLEQAKLNPNDKLKAAMAPKIPTADGIVIDTAEVQGFIVTLPAGTILPVELMNDLSSQRNKSGEVFLAKTPDNYITKENYLIMPVNTPITGQLLESKSGIYFIRDGKLVLNTQHIKTVISNDIAFVGLNVEEYQKLGFWQNLGRVILKGKKIGFNEGNIVSIKLVKPLKIDLTNGAVIE